MKTLKEKIATKMFKAKVKALDLMHKKLTAKDGGMELLQVVIIIVIALVVAAFVVAFLTGNFLPKFQNKIDGFTDNLFQN